eukprot:1111647-Amphidinium_carterae.4
MESYTRLDARSRLQRAWRAKGRTPYAVEDVHPGTLVYVWRQGKLGKKGWHGPGTVVATLGPRKESLYVALGASLWKVSARNTRKASPQEQIAEKAVEKFVRALKTKPGRSGLRRYVDCTREPQHLEEEEGSDGEQMPRDEEEAPSIQEEREDLQRQQDDDEVVSQQIVEDQSASVQEEPDEANSQRGRTRQASEPLELDESVPQRRKMGAENDPIDCDDLEADVVLATAADDKKPALPQNQLDTGTMTTVRPEALPEQHRRLFTEARRVEEQKLLPALTILSPKEAALVPKHRIIPSRWLDS